MQTLNDVLIIFSLSVGVLFICHRIRIPAIVGYLITGVLAGPYGFGLVHGVHEVEVMAEVGVVLLLFTIGIEFSLKNLLIIKKSVLLGGSLQVLLTIGAIFGMMRWIGFGFGEAMLMGFLISLSSTAIVLRLLQEKAQIDTPHGKTALGILIFQDIVIVPMMLIVPLLAGATENAGTFLLILLAKGIGIILLVIVSARWIVPQLLYQVARTRSRELFLLCVVTICFAAAWLTAGAGLSLALGAFMAGLIISESEYSHQAISNILPFRDVFTSFFFVSIGMLLDIRVLLADPGTIFAWTLIIMGLKGFIICGVTLVLGLPIRTAVIAGLTLCQVGEFSFVLSKTGLEYGLLADEYPLFLSIAVISMASSPFLMAGAPRMADLFMRLPLPQRLLTGQTKDFAPDGEKPLHNHLVIIGFGLNGRNLSQAAKKAGIPYVITEMNPETVKKERKKGEPIYFGDAVHDPVLEHLHVAQARVAVVAINDAAAVRNIVETLRRLNPGIHIIARTRFVNEMAPLVELGANEVIPEEFETSVEIFVRVLREYLIPADEIARMVDQIRASGYEMLRSISPEPLPPGESTLLPLPDVDIRTFRICAGSEMDGKSLAEIGLRQRYGVTAIAVRRAGKTRPNPQGDTHLLADDVIYLLGSPEKIAAVGPDCLAK